MPDLIFENRRLVSIYDGFDGPRVDLENYVSLLSELGAKSILDVGSGTGCFASMLAEKGFDVVGVEPAQASIEFAQKKPYAEKVRWITGDATKLSALDVDVAVMTGNVAQVFLTDKSWNETLACIKYALKKNGLLVFEVRNPSQKAWLQWTREKTYQRVHFPEIGNVDGWCEITNIDNELVSFKWTYIFESDGCTLTSDSTLRFRDRQSIETSLYEAGFAVKDVRDAPDRPGMEFIFIAKLR